MSRNDLPAETEIVLKLIQKSMPGLLFSLYNEFIFYFGKRGFKALRLIIPLLNEFFLFKELNITLQKIRRG